MDLGFRGNGDLCGEASAGWLAHAALVFGFIVIHDCVDTCARWTIADSALFGWKLGSRICYAYSALNGVPGDTGRWFDGSLRNQKACLSADRDIEGYYEARQEEGRTDPN